MFSASKLQGGGISDPYWGSTSLLLHGDGADSSTSIIDSTGLNTVTAYGGAQLKVAQSKYGPSSIYFAGATTYVAPANNSRFSFGSADFTVEMWIYPTITPSDNLFFECRSNGNTGTTDGFCLGAFSGSVIRIWSNGALVTSSGTTYVGQWTHIAAVRQSGTTKLYIGGVSVGTPSAAVYNSTTGDAIIGAGRAGAPATINSFFTGYIDDVRITKGVARYTSDFTPSLTAFPNR